MTVQIQDGPIDVSRVEWFQSFIASFSAGEAHAFILSGDIDGYVSRNLPHRTLLTNQLSARYEIVATYDRSRGVTFVTPDMEARASALVGGGTVDPMVAQMLGGANGNQDSPFAQAREPAAAIDLLGQLLRNPEARNRVAVLIDYADTIVPADRVGGKQGMSPADRSLLVALQVWARDPVLERQDNPVFLFTQDIGDIHADIAGGVGWKSITIALPDRDSRAAFVNWYIDRREQQVAERDQEIAEGSPKPPRQPLRLDDGVTVDMIANLTAGLNLRGLEDILLLGLREGIVTRALVKGRKDQIIASQYSDLAETIEPVPDEDLGGMQWLRALAQDEIIDPVLNGSLQDVPKGMLLVGPPGTGKTFWVRWLAGRIGFNALALRAENILGGIVGESEAKLLRFLDLARSISPVVIFVDEIDQSDMGSRGNSSGNPVAKNLFSQLLQFMSDETLRGKVIVIFASNRPDLLDPALLRFGRMDAIIPVLLPADDERKAIAQAQARSQRVTFAKDALPILVQRTDKYSAADIGAIVSKARKIARRRQSTKLTVQDVQQALQHIQPSTPQTADFFTSAAINACNDREFLPEPYASMLDDRETLARRIDAQRPEGNSAGRRERDW